MSGPTYTCITNAEHRSPEDQGQAMPQMLQPRLQQPSSGVPDEMEILAKACLRRQSMLKAPKRAKRHSPLSQSDEGSMPVQSPPRPSKACIARKADVDCKLRELDQNINLKRLCPRQRRRARIQHQPIFWSPYHARTITEAF